MTVRLSECIPPVFHELHRDVRRGGHAEYWLRGGRGSGKSSFVSMEILLGMARDENASAIIYRKVANTLRESVFGQMLWAIDRLGLSGEYVSRLEPLEIENVRTGQRILFRGADKPRKSKSIKLAKGYFGFLWFEELDEFSGIQDVRTIKASILRGVGCPTAGAAPQLRGGPADGLAASRGQVPSFPGRGLTFCTYNPPQSARNWVNAEALLTRPDRRVHQSDYRDVPEAWLGKAFIEEAEMLRQTDERAWRHMYLGEITGTGGQVFDNLELRELTEDELSAGRAYCGLDFGFAVDPDAFIRASYDPARRRLWVLEEFCRSRTPAETLAKEVRSRAEGVVRCDSADPRMIHQLRERGVNAIAVKKGPGSVAAGMRWLQELSAIIIDPERCPHAAREFAGYEYPPAPDGGFLSEYPDRNNHLIDALRYAMEPEISRKAARTLEGFI